MHDPSKASRRAAATFIYVTIMLDMMCFGMIGPILPKLIASFVGNDLSRASWAVGIFGVAWAIMQFFSSPIFGVLSDRLGRRPIILLSNLGTSLDYVIMALAPNLSWLFAGRVISGATTASVNTAMAYIADVTPPEKRAGAYGLVGSAFGLGFIIGPAIGGFLGTFDPRVPFWAAAALSAINFLYGLFVVPESLAPEHRSERFAWGKANPVGALKFLGRHRELSGLATVNFLGDLAHEIFPYVWVLYCMARYSWNTAQIGMTLALVGITSALSSAFAVQPIVKWLGERRTLLVGLGIGAVTYAMFGASDNGWVFLCAIVVGAMAISGPPSQALMTHRVGPSEQGELQGALGAVRSVTMIIGPLLFTSILAQAIGPWRSWHLEGAPWFLASLLVLISLPIAYGATNHDDDVVLDTPAQLESVNPLE